jgi:AcrR family transcriptional regulator
MTAADAAADTAADVVAAVRRSRSRKGEGQRLRDQILEVTEQLLLTTGSSEAVSIRAVANAVGVTPPSIYRHFPDKTTLIFEVCDRHFRALDTSIAEATEGIDDPVEALQAAGRTYVEFGTSNPEPYRIMFMTRSDETPDKFQDERLAEITCFGRVMGIVADCIDAGRFRPEHTDAARLSMGFWARVHGLTSLLVAKPAFPWPDDGFVAEYMQSCLRGLLID